MRKEILIPLLAVLLAVKFAVDHVGDVDLFWHLRLGLDLLAQGAMRQHVPYTWTYDGNWPAFDWLAQILIAGAYRIDGYLSLALFKAMLSAILTLCLYRAALLRAGGNVRAAGAALFLAIFIAAANFSSRPLFLAHVLLAIEVLLLEEARQGRRWALWLLPPLFALWGNLHGSWPFGLGPIAAFAAESWLPLRLRFWRPRALDDLSVTSAPALTGASSGGHVSRLHGWVTAHAFRPARPQMALGGLAALVGCVLAQLATPEPLRFLARPFQWVGKNTEVWMTEWAAVPLDHPSFWMLLFTGSLFAFAILRSRRPLPLFEVLFVALAFALALAKFRLIAYFALVCVPLLAGLLAAHISPEGFRNRRSNAAIAAFGLLLLGGVSLFNLSRVDEAVEGIVPKEAVEALQVSGRAQARGFNYFDWGGYLVLRQIPTFIDGRLEPFEASGVLDEYMRIEREADLNALEARGIDWILTRGDLPLARALAAGQGWALAHRSTDGTGAELWLREAGR